MPLDELSLPVERFVTAVKTIIFEDQTVEEAIEILRTRSIKDRIVYFYVLDTKMRLKGVVSTRRLLLSKSKKRITEVMERSVVCLSGKQSLEEALEFLEIHHLLALPVVDDEHRFLGIIDVDLYLEETMDIANSRIRSDIFQLIGMYLEEGKKYNPFRSYVNRISWITCNMLAGISCAIISRRFELVLSHYLVLAFFIPLVLTLSESISMQSVTNAIQQLRGGNSRTKSILGALAKELPVVLLLSVTCGTLVGSISLLWGEGKGPAFVIGIGVCISITISALSGASIPLLLHIKQWDPKVAAGPVALMIADIITTMIYLSLGTWWLI